MQILCGTLSDEIVTIHCPICLLSNLSICHCLIQSARSFRSVTGVDWLCLAAICKYNDHACVEHCRTKLFVHSDRFFLK